MTVRWTDTALRHLDSIYNYISQDSEFYGKRMVDRITSLSIQIGEFPYSGRIVPEYEDQFVREVFIEPYRIIYRIKDDCIDVLSVIHGSRNKFEDILLS